ncbi:MAG: carboxypeptidase-like regulatory domain-containing protein [Saprospiraceae bacterium]|nr:carboxypeptidase-like regulatory domain-containing protein [Saprospiraceae bacterium]
MKKILLLILGLLFLVEGYTQDRILKGKVTDLAGSPLIGASVYFPEAGHATITDIAGKFRIQLPDTLVVLEFSYVGFEKKREKVAAGATDLHIQLKEGGILSESVVITGKEGLEFSDMAISEELSLPKSAAPAELKIRGTASHSFARSAAASPSMASPSMAPVSADFAGGASFLDREAAKVAAGQLTAGELHDFSKWELWQDIAESDLETYQKSWKIHPKQRYAVQLLGEKGKPLVNVKVMLKDGAQTIWESFTDNTGKAELWANLFEETQMGNALSIHAEVGGKSYPFKGVTTFHQGINMLKVPTYCDLNDAVDIAFMVDATGSMGDEIHYLQAELADVIDKVKDTLPGLSLRTGSIFYRDRGEQYLTRTSPLQADLKPTLDFIKKQSAGGGGDYPEAVEEGLERALKELDWNPKARARLLFMVLDAPPHQDDSTVLKMTQLTQLAAAKGIRIIPVVASGINKSAEYLFRSIALATNGTYVFLTDDSGIGNPHIKPTTDDWEVEKLNDLMVRLVYQFSYAPDCEEEMLEENIADLWPSPIRTSPSDIASLWKLFPNPTAGPLTVNWDNSAPEEVFLSDLNGKILKRFAAPDPRFQLDLSAFPAGSYLIGFEKDGKWESKQVFRIQS